MIDTSFRAMLLYAARAASGATIALLIAMSLGLDEPHWAAWTVISVSLPASGDAFQKSLYRMLGTLVGAVAAFLLVIGSLGAHALLICLLSAWLITCVYIGLRLQPAAGYAAVLAGYGAVVVAIASVDANGGIHELALLSATRFAAIAIGVITSIILLATTEMTPPQWCAIAGDVFNLGSTWRVFATCAEEQHKRALFGALRAGACLQLAGMAWLSIHWEGGGLLVSFTGITAGLFSIRANPKGATIHFMCAAVAGALSALMLHRWLELLSTAPLALPIAQGVLAFTAVLLAAIFGNGFFASCYCLVLFVLADPQTFAVSDRASLAAKGAGILVGSGIALLGYLVERNKRRQ
ncbi:FUSC family protein [Pseudoduganella sp. UC29_106]|uniref:FUSC family protein n=1 Tax=Pseudoduganella sp. UC29_106 TaxID=3374553 RepID=UPI003756CA2D